MDNNLISNETILLKLKEIGEQLDQLEGKIRSNCILEKNIEVSKQCEKLVAVQDELIQIESKIEDNKQRLGVNCLKAV